VLLTNFLHHFDPPTNEILLRKVHASLADGGRAVTLELCQTTIESHPEAATFSMMMLTSTPSGDAYTFAELEKMAANAVLEEHRSSCRLSIQTVVISGVVLSRR
jgi:hypothetical protein